MAAGGIQCPKCGAPSSVTETRKVSREQTRRRRVCDVITCGKRFTTVELIVSGASDKHGPGNVAVVNRFDLTRLVTIAKRLAGEPT